MYILRTLHPTPSSGHATSWETGADCSTGSGGGGGGGGGRIVAVSVHAPGINATRFADVLASPLAAKRLARLRGLFAGRTVLLGVDELEPTQGVGVKLDAFSALLQRDPSLATRAVMVQARR